jgi:alkyl hydroperoxide reductase subunit F
VLNSDGKGKNFPDEYISRKIKDLRGPIHLSTYVSLTCTNCPGIVQALNMMAVLNPGISHEMVDGAINQQEVETLKLQGVPAVFADGELGDLLTKLENQYGSVRSSVETEAKAYDVIVVGGGPAGSAAAIYSARKGLHVAVLAERVGGQVKETVGIENLISVPKTTGDALAANLKLHMDAYSIDILEHRSVTKVEVADGQKIIQVNSGERFTTPA